MLVWVPSRRKIGKQRYSIVTRSSGTSVNGKGRKEQLVCAQCSKFWDEDDNCTVRR